MTTRKIASARSSRARSARTCASSSRAASCSAKRASTSSPSPSRGSTCRTSAMATTTTRASARARAAKPARPSTAMNRGARSGGHRPRPAHPRGRCHARRAGRHPRRRARTAADRAEGPAQHHDDQGPLQQRARRGPESLRHFKRTFRRALRRMIMSGATTRTTRSSSSSAATSVYRSWKEVKKPQSNAVIVYMMDVSGSMGASRRKSCGSRRSGSTPGCGATTRASRAATSSTTCTRLRSIARRSSTSARTAARDQLRVQVLPRDARVNTTPRRMEHLPVPLLRRRQLVGGRQRASAAELLRKHAAADLESVRLLPGGQRVRLGHFINVLREHLSQTKRTWSPPG
jgi:hypothetical protein